jgi:hypothetical protein
VSRQSPNGTYWKKRAVAAEELLIHVGCDPKWTATVDAHFKKVGVGELSNRPTAAEAEADK